MKRSTHSVAVWFLLSAIGLMRDVYASRLAQQGREGAVVLLRPAAQFLGLLIVVVAVLLWLDNVGFNITTLLAGLGVGGIAVALALRGQTLYMQRSTDQHP